MKSFLIFLFMKESLLQGHLESGMGQILVEL
jgi:hypothetical protein